MIYTPLAQLDSCACLCGGRSGVRVPEGVPLFKTWACSFNGRGGCSQGGRLRVRVPSGPPLFNKEIIVDLEHSSS